MDEPTEERYIHSLIGETFEEEDIDANTYIRTNPQKKLTKGLSYKTQTHTFAAG